MVGQPDLNYQPQCFEGYRNQYNNQSKKGNQCLMPNFKMEWMIHCSYPYQDLTFLPQNPMNQSIPAYQSNNCQEVSNKLGNFMCYLIMNEGVPAIENIPLLNQMLFEKDPYYRYFY
jgi:hypothetical protein